MREGAGVGALVRLRRRLEEGAIVSITAGCTAAQTIEVPFMGGRLVLPAGALELGLGTRSPLIPLYTERHAAGGRSNASSRRP
jgi:hypothetical protein